MNIFLCFDLCEECEANLYIHVIFCFSKLLEECEADLEVPEFFFSSLCEKCKANFGIVCFLKHYSVCRGIKTKFNKSKVFL